MERKAAEKRALTTKAAAKKAAAKKAAAKKAPAKKAAAKKAPAKKAPAKKAPAKKAAAKKAPAKKAAAKKAPAQAAPPAPGYVWRNFAHPDRHFIVYVPGQDPPERVRYTNPYTEAAELAEGGPGWTQAVAVPPNAVIGTRV